VEILKGPSTLLYGAGAIGGVVDVHTGRIPHQIPFSGRFEGRLVDNADRETAALRLDVGGGAVGGAFVGERSFERFDLEAGAGIVRASIDYFGLGSDAVLTVFVQGRNLTDDDQRQHSSFRTAARPFFPPGWRFTAVSVASSQGSNRWMAPISRTSRPATPTGTTTAAP